MPDGVAWLFCPGDRPERYGKAADRSDVVILDLEDGVATTNRGAARRSLLDNPLDPDRTIVRINPVGTADHALDLDALSRTEYRTVMLAKTEQAGEVKSLAPLRVVGLCETPLGVLNSPAIAAAENLDALLWGAEDLIAALGGQSSRDASGTYRDVVRHARSSVLLAAGAMGKAAVDAVYLDIADLPGLTAEVVDAVHSGFAAKACIHPRQVSVVKDAYAPSEQSVAWAQRLLAAAEGKPGVFAWEGSMVDEPILRQARTILLRASAGQHRPRLP
jgi:citrate lyase subunit beta/citryl-CoA lyase